VFSGERSSVIFWTRLGISVTAAPRQGDKAAASGHQTRQTRARD
jgi:hypothetical protein